MIKMSIKSQCNDLLTSHQDHEGFQRFCSKMLSIVLISYPSQMLTLLCKHLMVSFLTTHCVLYVKSKLRRGDRFTDSTLFGEESLTSNRKSESILVVIFIL